MKRALALAFGLILWAAPVANAEAPTLGTFSSINFAFGSTTAWKIVPPTTNSTGTWSYASSNKAVAVINGDSIIPIAIGSATITATQSADAKYSSATVSTTLTISKGDPTLGTFSDQYYSYTGAKNSKYTIAAPLSNSSGTWTFTSLNPAVATITGNVATILSLGVAPITASQAGTSNFNPSQIVTMNLHVVGPAPTLGTWPAITKTYSDGSFVLTPPTSTSKGAWSFTSSKPEIASVSGFVVTILNVGSVTISGKQMEDQIYGPTTASVKLTITKSLPTIGTLLPITVRANDPGLDLVGPTSNSDGTWNFSTGDKKIATIKNGKLFGLVPGTTTLTANQNEGKLYLASQPLTTTITVTNPALPVNPEPIFDLTIFAKSAPTPYLPPKDGSSGAWTVTSSNLDTVRIGTENGFTLIPISLGSSTITITQAPAGDFAGFTKTFKVTVIPKIVYSVKLSGRNIIVSTKDKNTTVTIDNKSGKIGNNLVSKGKHRVRLSNQGVYFDKTFTVK